MTHLLIPRKRSDRPEEYLRLRGWQIDYLFDNAPAVPIAVSQESFEHLLSDLNLLDTQGLVTLVANNKGGSGYHNPSAKVGDIGISISTAEVFYHLIEKEIDGCLDASLTLGHELRHYWQSLHWNRWIQRSIREKDAEEFELNLFHQICAGRRNACFFLP